MQSSCIVGSELIPPHTGPPYLSFVLVFRLLLRQYQFTTDTTTEGKYTSKQESKDASKSITPWWYLFDSNIGEKQTNKRASKHANKEQAETKRGCGTELIIFVVHEQYMWKQKIQPSRERHPQYKTKRWRWIKQSCRICDPIWENHA